MFDLGWSELLVVAIVAILVVGPKDLPRMLRTVGRMMGKVRRTANDFRRQFDDALREAEREVDLEETRKSLNSIGKIDPVGDIRKELKSAAADIEKPATTPSGGGNGASVPSYEPAEDDPIRKPEKKTSPPKPGKGTADASKPAPAKRAAAKPTAAKPASRKPGRAKPAEKAGTESGAS